MTTQLKGFIQTKPATGIESIQKVNEYRNIIKESHLSITPSAEQKVINFLSLNRTKLDLIVLPYGTKAINHFAQKMVKSSNKKQTSKVKNHIAEKCKKEIKKKYRFCDKYKIHTIFSTGDELYLETIKRF